MKLMLIITDYGSFNNFLAELALFLVEQTDIEVCVVCSKSKVIDIEDKDVFLTKLKFHFIDIPRTITILGEWKAAKQMRRVIELEQPDLVHSHFTTATFPVILFKVKNIPYWATFHGLGMNASSGFKKLIFSLVETLCFIRLQKIFTVNHKDFRLVKKFFVGKVLKYDCLGFGCNIDKFDKTAIDTTVISALKNNYRIVKGNIVITFTGRYVSFKGFDLVIKSFKQLSEQTPGVYKLILMGGPDPIHSTGITDSENIFFSDCKDIINVGFTNEVEKFLAITDIFLFPSKKEGLPTCILEALSIGIPVITFKARGNEDIITHEYNGLLLATGFDKAVEVEMICDSIIYLSNNEAERFKFKNNALKDREKYDRKRFIDEHIYYYNNIVRCN